MADIAEGTVTKVNKPMTGETEHGEWTMYKFVVTDSQGDHQCSTFSESIGVLIKKGVTLKFSYEDNEFTTKKGEVVKEWRINELFGDVAPSSEPSPPAPTQQSQQSFPGGPREGMIFNQANEWARKGSHGETTKTNLDLIEGNIVLMYGVVERALLRIESRAQSPTDTSSASVEQSSGEKALRARDWPWFMDTVKTIYEKDKDAVMRACGGLELKDYIAVQGNPQTPEEVLIHCVQFWADEPTVDDKEIPW